ncbi:hypothetical protein F5Y09DRAFT_296222 [Xylaria sp. FL1042]|nr:hypothetical protein F5Y09DRAFT_296222 [Xylaria sp. FL1042]
MMTMAVMLVILVSGSVILPLQPLASLAVTRNRPSVAIEKGKRYFAMGFSIVVSGRRVSPICSMLSVRASHLHSRWTGKTKVS